MAAETAAARASETASAPSRTIMSRVRQGTASRAPDDAEQVSGTQPEPDRPGQDPGAGNAAVTTSQQIVAALVFPDWGTAQQALPSPLPLPDLRWLPRDGSMLYGIARIDASGRVVHNKIVRALGWHPGDAVEVLVAERAIVLRTSPAGIVYLPERPCVVVPVTARRRRAIEPGDYVLLAAAPDHGIVLVHTLAELDDMLTRYHSAGAGS